jgi:hypothetical protein
VPGFPNFSMLYGPNTNQGNVIFGLETAANYTVRNLRRLRRSDATWIEVRPAAFRLYNRWLQWRLAKSALATAKNYHKSPSGRLVLPFPTNMGWYWVFCHAFRIVANRTGRGDGPRSPSAPGWFRRGRRATASSGPA